MTVLDLIKLALKQAGVVGVGQSVSPEDTNDSLTLLNAMLGQWAVKRWLVYALQDLALTSTGAETYTYGPGGNFNAASTDHLEGAYFRLLNATAPNQQADFPLQLLTAYEDYARIRLKSLSTWPQCVFFDGAYPLANVRFWPIPQAGLYELHLLTKTPISAFTGLTQTINLPPQYQEALLYNLGLRLRTAYQLPPDPQLVALAQSALTTLRNSNAQVPRLTMPGILPLAPGYYNPISDQGT